MNMQVMTRIADNTPLRTLRYKSGCMPLNESAIACSSMNNIAHIAISKLGPAVTLNSKTWTCISQVLLGDEAS